MNENLLNKPVSYLTTGELMTAIRTEVMANLPQPQQIQETQKQFAHSIKEASVFFYCSPVTFQRWKNEGFVKYTQHGRKLIIDLDGTMELLNSKRAKK
jgi:hypothetical protein